MDKPLMFIKSTDTFIMAEHDPPLQIIGVMPRLQHAQIMVRFQQKDIQLLQLFNAVVQSLMRKGYDQRSIELAFASAIYQANCKNM